MPEEMENGTNYEEYDDYTTYQEFQTGLLIWRVVPPILIVFGTVGNSLAIVVLTRKSIKVTTTAIYLSFLAISDLVVLYTGLLRQWLTYLFDYDVRHISEAACKIHLWLVYSSLDFSAWIVMIVTVERLISAWFPHKAKNKCSRKSAIAIVTIVLFFLLALNSHLLYGMINEIVLDSNGHAVTVYKCSEIDETYRNFFNLIWPWIDLAVFCAIPFTVIVIGNCCILFKVVTSQRRTKSKIVPTTSKSTHATKKAPKHLSMTAMLLTLNTVFLLTTSPVSVYNIGYPQWSSVDTAQNYANLDFWWAIVNMLMYTNNALNFLLYCLSGTRFRREVKRAFHQSSNVSRDRNNRSHVLSDFPSRMPSFKPSEQETSTALQVPSNLQLNSAESLFGSCNSLHPSSALSGSFSMTRVLFNNELASQGSKSPGSAINSMEKLIPTIESSSIVQGMRTQVFPKGADCLQDRVVDKDRLFKVIPKEIAVPSITSGLEDPVIDMRKLIQTLPNECPGKTTSTSSLLADTRENEIYASYMDSLKQTAKLASTLLALDASLERSIEEECIELPTISGNTAIEIKVESAYNHSK